MASNEHRTAEELSPRQVRELQMQRDRLSDALGEIDKSGECPHFALGYARSAIREVNLSLGQLIDEAQPPVAEFPIRTPKFYGETERHVRVITGTGNASEQRELDALCRGLRPQS